MRRPALLGILLTVAIAGCSPDPVRREGVFVMPAKDHLWTAEGRAFSASELEALQEKFPPVSRDDLVRLSQWLSLYDALRSEGKIHERISLEQFGTDLRQLLPPTPSAFNAREFANHVQRSYASESPSTWRSELERRVRVKHFEWNPSLLKDYGISPR